MKIICTQENLKNGLATVGRIISSTNTLPILNNLLLKTQDGQLRISSTNLEIAITTQVRCKVEEDGEITVANKTLNELISNLPNKNISLETVNNELKIEAENYHTKIKTLPAEEFPLIPSVEGGENLALEGQEFKKAVDQVVFAASNNQTQPEISGVFISLEKNELRIAATDRYRLAERKMILQHSVNTPVDAIIPQKTILELSRIIGNQSGQVNLVLNPTQISLDFNDTQIISRLIDGQYPDYKQIIPAEFSTNVETEKQPLVSALKAASIFTQNNHSVRFEFSAQKQTLVLKAESSDLGSSVVELPSKVEGKDGEIILNHHYVLDCLSSVDSPEVVFKIIDDSSPSLIVPKEKSDYIYLVMPIKS
jgi:DNA polymerase-3 subunit beta